MGYEKVKSEIQKNINDHLEKYESIMYILIVTALHYGCANENGIYSNKKLIYTLGNHNDNIVHIHQIISEQKVPVVLQSSANTDEDF